MSQDDDPFSLASLTDLCMSAGSMVVSSRAYLEILSLFERRTSSLACNIPFHNKLWNVLTQ